MDARRALSTGFLLLHLVGSSLSGLTSLLCCVSSDNSNLFEPTQLGGHRLLPSHWSCNQEGSLAIWRFSPDCTHSLMQSFPICARCCHDVAAILPLLTLLSTCDPLHLARAQPISFLRQRALLFVQGFLPVLPDHCWAPALHSTCADDVWSLPGNQNPAKDAEALELQQNNPLCMIFQATAQVEQLSARSACPCTSVPLVKGQAARLLVLATAALLSVSSPNAAALVQPGPRKAGLAGTLPACISSLL